MKTNRWIVILSVAVLTGLTTASMAEKPTPDAVLKMLTDGNSNFVKGKMSHPNVSADRILLASKENQGDYAIATVMACSDSRVPVEYIFDQGIMDLFIIRVAGNVCNVDEIGSAEYGVCHVKTPVLVVMGHSQCGAVTAVAHAVLGAGHALEKNIPPLVETIIPAVEKVRTAFPQASEENLITRSVEENVWRGIEQIYLKSAAIREMAKAGKVAVVGAIYELETGTVKWLSKEKSATLLEKALSSPDRSMEAMASSEGHETAPHGEAKAESHTEKPAEKTESHH